jgi:hypothetical protein
MAYFQTQNPILGKFLSVLQLVMLINFKDIWSIFTAIWHMLCPFGTFCDYFCIFFPVVGYVVPRKSGNLANDRRKMAGNKKWREILNAIRNVRDTPFYM